MTRPKRAAVMALVLWALTAPAMGATNAATPRAQAAPPACDLVWAEPVDGDWTDLTKWDLTLAGDDRFPSVDDVACLTAAGTDYTVHNIGSAEGLVVGESATAVVCCGELSFDTIENAGHLIIGGQIDILSRSGGITNAGLLEIPSAGFTDLFMELGGASVVNELGATIRVGQRMNLNRGRFENHGVIEMLAESADVDSDLRLREMESVLGGTATGSSNNIITAIQGRTVLDIALDGPELRLSEADVLFRDGFAGVAFANLEVRARGTVPPAGVLIPLGGEEFGGVVVSDVADPFFAPGELQVPDPDDHPLENDGTLTLDSFPGATTGTALLVFDSSTLTPEERDRGERADPAPFINRGTLEVTSGALRDLDVSVLHNFGTFILGASINMRGLVNEGDVQVLPGETLIVQNQLVLEEGSVVGDPGSTVKVFRGLSGSGTIGGDLDLDSELEVVFAPGSSPGSLVVNGDLIMGELTKTVLEVRGDGASDHIEVLGDALLDGALEVNFVDEAAFGLPEVCSVFDLLDANDLLGEFDGLSLNASADGSRDLLLGLRSSSLSVVAVDPDHPVNVDPTPVVITEGSSAPVTMCLSEPAAFDNALTVDDNADASGPVEVVLDAPFPAAVPLTARIDRIDEPDEVVTVTGGATGENAAPITAGGKVFAAFVIGGFAVDITILDGDLAPTPFLDAPSTLEGNAGNKVATVIVSLSHPSAFTITGTIATAGGTAVPGVDYVPIDQQLSFSPGDTEELVSVTLLSDGADEDDETIGISLSNLQNAASASGATITIVDDDVALGAPVPPAILSSRPPAGPVGPTTTTATTTPGPVLERPERPSPPEVAAGPTPEVEPEPEPDDAVAEVDDHVRASLPASLPRPSEVSFDLADVARSLGLAALLLLLLLFPAELLNKTIEENYDDITRRFAWLRRLFGRSRRGHLLPSWLRIWPFVAIGASVYVLLDPGAEVLDDATLSLGIGLAIALVVTVAVYELPIRFAVRREEVAHEFSVFPAALVAGLLFVLLSRGIGFQPGYLFGLIAGFVFVGVADRREGRGIALAGVVLLTVSLGAWLMWDPIADAAEGADPSLLTLIADSALAATFVAGLETLVFGMVPLRFLDGHKVWQWSKIAWLGIAGLGMFFFVHLLVGSTSYVDKTNTVSTVTIAVLFGGFGLFSVLFWLYWRNRRRQDEPDGGEPVNPYEYTVV